MTTINSYTRRKNQLIECCEDANPVSRHFIDADCVYENGVFKLTSLPARLPLLFTVRFTAPADYAAGNEIALKGKKFKVKTSGMVIAPENMFAAGAVVHCDIDMERRLAFLHVNHGVTEDHQCYYPRVHLYVETTGDDDAGDGSEAAPLRSINGVFALLERDYVGYIKRLDIHLGYGHFAAPKVWIDSIAPYTIGYLWVEGKNGVAKNYTATTIGDSGCTIYNNVENVFLANVSLLCRDESNTTILNTRATNCNTGIVGYCEIINASDVAKQGVSIVGHSYLTIGLDVGENDIRFSGNFTEVIHASSHSGINLCASTDTSFQGTSSSLFYINGASSLYVYSTKAPVFMGGFKGNIRAINGATIALRVSPESWLPAGSQWIKDDISRITGQ